MIESGRVLALDEQHVWVETVAQSSCNSCSARKGCGQATLASMHPSRQNSLRLAQPSSGIISSINLNDTVDFSVPDTLISTSAALVYLMPLLFMMASVIVANLMALSEGVSILLALSSLGIGFIAVHKFAVGGLEKKMAPTIVAVRPTVADSQFDHVKFL